ncbi:MAG: glycosyltransferase, partial [Pirellula sp.]
DWTISKHRILSKRFIVAHNGVDLDTFRPREDFLSRREPVSVLFIGRIDRNKGPDIAACAVEVLQREGHPVTLTVVGGLWFYGNTDPSEDPFFQILKKKMDQVNASYLGHVERGFVPELVRQHDVVCVLSRTNEPFGLVVLEAMASGCAVIASNRGGLPEACENAALLVDEANPVAVSDALRSLVIDRMRLNDYKQKGISRAAQLPWSKCASILESAVQAL